MHESRSKHARGRPRGPGGKFLTKVKSKRKREKVQNSTTDEYQTPKTKAGPNISHAKKESVDWAAGIPTKDEKGQQREEVRNGSRDEEADEPQANQISNIRSEYRNETKGPLDTKVEFGESTEVFDGKVKAEMGEAEGLGLSKYLGVALVARYLDSWLPYI
jgi:hypothetical protein